MFKKTLLWAILALGIYAQTQAQGIIIQGSVRLAGTTLPIPNQRTYLVIDQLIGTSVVYHVDSTFTDSTGHYSFVFNPNLNSTSNLIRVFTICSGPFQSDTTTWTHGNPAPTLNLFCSQMPSAQITGHATPVSPIIDTVLFSLYRLTTSGPVLESTFLSQNWGIPAHAPYSLSANTTPNNYQLKAEFTPGSPSAALYLPTWYGNTTNISNATIITLNPNSQVSANIVFQPRQASNLAGTVTGNTAGNPAQNDSIRLILIQVQNNTWTPVDTFYTTDSMGVAPFFKSTTRTGTHSLLASLMGSNAANFVPTYFGNATTWSAASTFNLSNGSTVVVSIALQAAGGTGGGGGGAGGGVNQGGLPIVGSTGMPGVQLQLHNLQGQVLKAVHTNAQGIYSMTNLAFGSYKMHVEMMGMPFTAYPFTLSSSNPNAQLHFTVNQSGIAASLEQVGFNLNGVYPNPARDLLTISLSSQQASALKIQLLDMTGRQVLTSDWQVIEGEGSKELSLQGIPAGVYLLELRSNNGFAAQRIVIQ